MNSNLSPTTADECVGNSHALIMKQLTADQAICACGHTLHRITDPKQIRTYHSGAAELWVHQTPETWGTPCPPYSCEDCGKRHNPRRYTIAGTGPDGRPWSREARSWKQLEVLARIALQDGTDIEIHDQSGRDITFEVAACKA